MSRQRLRPSLAETSFIPCPHCGGTGHVRSTENAAIHVLRGIEDEGSKRRSAEVVVYVSTPVALYLLNHKRERLRTRSPDEVAPLVTVERPVSAPVVEFAEEEEEEAEAVGSDDDDDDAE